MNYWPAEVTNLTELNEPLFRLTKEVSETGAETARIMYGADGCVASQHGYMAHYRAGRPRSIGHVARWRRLAK